MKHALEANERYDQGNTEAMVHPKIRRMTMSRVPFVSWINSRVRSSPALGRFALRCLPNANVHMQLPVLGSLQINLRRNRSFWLRDPLLVEQPMFNALRRLIHPGDVVYDAGSNIGLYARFIISVSGASKVIAFEPMPDNLALLRHNIDIGGIADKVRVFPCALSETDSQEEFQLDDMSSASATLSRISGGNACQGRRQYGLAPLTAVVTTRNIDSVVEGEGCPPPDVIKIDVEGAEGLVVSGARRTLLKYRPRLAIELHGIDCGQAVVPQLNRLGYHCYGFLVKDGVECYSRVTNEDVADLKSQYDLHFLFASCDAADVDRPFMYETIH